MEAPTLFESAEEERDRLDRETLCAFSLWVGGDVDKLSRAELRVEAEHARQRHRSVVAERRARRLARA